MFEFWTYKDDEGPKLSLDWYVTGNELERAIKRNKYRTRMGMSPAALPTHRKLVLFMQTFGRQFNLTINIRKL